MPVAGPRVTFIGGTSFTAIADGEPQTITVNTRYSVILQQAVARAKKFTSPGTAPHTVPHVVNYRANIAALHHLGSTVIATASVGLCGGKCPGQPGLDRSVHRFCGTALRALTEAGAVVC